MNERGFEGLKVWQRSHQLMLDIHHLLIPLLPKDERYGLNDQIRRSSKSVGANLYLRELPPDYLSENATVE